MELAQPQINGRETEQDAGVVGVKRERMSKSFKAASDSPCMCK
jgi:hypothetical protein